MVKTYNRRKVGSYADKNGFVMAFMIRLEASKQPSFFEIFKKLLIPLVKFVTENIDF